MKMKIVYMMEWDVPKDRDRYKRYAEYHSKETRSARSKKFSNLVKWIREKKAEGVLKSVDWADDTGHVINWKEFESIELFSEMWANEEWQQHMMEVYPLVDNLRFRMLRESLGIPED